MLRRMILQVLSGAFVCGLSACAPTTGDRSTLAGGETVMGVSCSQAVPAVALDQIQVQGPSSADANQTVTFSINPELACSSSQMVSWKLHSGDQVAASATELEAVFSKAGTYVVTAEVTSLQNPTPLVYSLSTTVVSDSLMISSPDISMVGVVTNFSLAVPSGVGVSEVGWSFGDGSPLQSSQGVIDHVYGRSGAFVVQAQVKDASGAILGTLQKNVQVLPLQDGLECVTELAVNGPAEVIQDQATALSVFVPNCLLGKIKAMTWSYGDGGALDSGQNVSHSFSQVGSFDVSVGLFAGTNLTTPWVTLHHTVVVSAQTSNPPPTPSITPTPTPTPVGDCLLAGQNRQTLEDLYTENQECGVQGNQVLSYRDQLTEQCQLQAGVLRWVEISREKVLQSTGRCEDQSCVLPGEGGLIPNGSSRTYFQSSLPQGSCAEVTELRSCQNGVLSGSATQTSCQSGCPGFGPHGTSKASQVIGEVSVPKICSFQEPGFFDVFSKAVDQSCQDGTILNQNERPLALLRAGRCPTYHWSGTDQWSTCSADCGGEQSRQFECLSDQNVKVDSSRCLDLQPVESRVCDGNLAAVQRVEVLTRQEEAPSSSLCPANQIGVIVNLREVTTTKRYGCVAHQIGLESESSQATAWTENRYCEDLVPHRCSQDSLSNAEAHGRYLWLKKCKSQNSEIRNFFDKFDEVDFKIGKTKYSIDGSGRNLYPTFMVRSSKVCKPSCEKEDSKKGFSRGHNSKSNKDDVDDKDDKCEKDRVWIAPKREKDECKIPEGAFIAAVCLSSCATPEEEILAQARGHGRLEPVPFVTALVQKYQFVATLRGYENSDKNHGRGFHFGKSKVDQWITELVDTTHEILVFKMKSGGELKVTPNHPLLSEDGRMRAASEFTEGESLRRSNGELDPIQSIHGLQYFGKVYNVFVQSADPKQNIVVTQGYLNGTAFFQNEGADKMNRELLRGRLIKGVSQ